MNVQRVPPNDLDAEASVLSTLLLDPAALADIERVIRPADFYSDANRRIAETIWSLDAAGSPVDVTTITHRLRDQQQLNAVGGTPYISQLIDATPAVAHVEEHAVIVADLARVRAVQAACVTVRAEGYEKLGNIAEWLSTAERRLLDALDRRQPVETQSTLREAITTELDKMQQGPVEILGFRTGLPDLDGMLGGLIDGMMYVVAGRPGKGKTAFAMQCALNAADQCIAQGRAVFFASLEMPREQLTQRALAQESGVTMDAIKWRRVQAMDWPKITDAAAYFGTLPLVIDEQPAQTPHGLRSAMRRALRKMPNKPEPGLIVVDYMQLMTTGSPREKGSNREQEVSEFSRSLASLAKEYRCPVMALSQMNRKVEDRAGQVPQLSDLRESGAIEQDAYGVLFICDDQIVVAKNRNGQTGSVPTRYDGTILKFYERDPTRDEDPQQKIYHDPEYEERRWGR